MRKLLTEKRILLVILVIASILRLWKLGSIPPHLTPDEASLGYNAYSILETGKDEYGKFLPIIFKSFGDYKPGLYVYLTAPFVALFGLNEFAVRLPNALAGILAVWLIYLIGKEFFKDNKVSGLAVLLLAINPWHIHFSRGAWEANVSLTLTLAGIFFFLKSLKKQKYLVLSAALFALTLLTYQGAKASSGIIVLILLVLYWGKLAKFKRKTLLKSLVLGLLISVPILLSLFQGRAGRLEVFSVFSYPRPADYLQEFLDQGGEKAGDLNYYLFHSEGVNFARGILGRLFNHYSDRFLFFVGDWQNPRHSTPYSGMFIFADLILFFVGFIALVRSKNWLVATFLISWVVLAPFPAALSRDQVHAVRALNMVIPLVVINGIGAATLIEKIRKKGAYIIKPAIFLLTLFYLANYAYYLDAYFVHLVKHNSKYWFYGYKQVVETITPIQADYEKIVFQQSYDQPYIYVLFYQKYDPAKYQAQAKLAESKFGDVGLVETLDNISFESFSWPPPMESGMLIVGDTIAIPGDFSRDDFNLISEIRYPDGENTAFRILEAR